MDLSGAFSSFHLADQITVDCGGFSVQLRRLSLYAEDQRFRAERERIRRSMSKVAAAGVQQDFWTGSLEGDIELLHVFLVKGWDLKDARKKRSISPWKPSGRSAWARPGASPRPWAGASSTS